MATRIALFALCLLPLWASAQSPIPTDTKDYQTARKRLYIGTDTARYFTAIKTVLEASNTHKHVPTAKAVYDYIQTVLPVLTAGTGISITGTYPALTIANTGDLSATNELQDLSLSGQTLSLTSDATTVTLPIIGVAAGTGISVSTTTGTAVVTNTGDTNAADDITTATSLGGDLTGTLPNPTVDGLQGRAVLSTAPSTGEVLKWNGTAWAPAADGGGAAGHTLKDDGTSMTARTGANFISTSTVTAALTDDAAGDETEIRMTVPADGITATEIATNAVGASEIAADAVGSSEIAADAVGSSEIATDAVGAAEIAADAVGASELASTAVAAGTYTNATVTFDADGRATSAISGTAPVTGTGTTNYVPKWTSASVLGNSSIIDDGQVGIGTTPSSLFRLKVDGDIALSGRTEAGQQGVLWGKQYGGHIRDVSSGIVEDLYFPYPWNPFRRLIVFTPLFNEGTGVSDTSHVFRFSAQQGNYSFTSMGAKTYYSYRGSKQYVEIDGKDNRDNGIRFGYNNGGLNYSRSEIYATYNADYSSNISFYGAKVGNIAYTQEQNRLILILGDRGPNGVVAIPDSSRLLVGANNGTYSSTPGVLTVNGIGSSSATYTAVFHNSTRSSNSLVIQDDSKVGISTSTPTQPLDVNGNTRLRSALYDGLNSPGSSGNILSSTGSATQWITAAALVAAGNALTTATSFAGDVTGVYNNLQLGTGVVGATELASTAVTAGTYGSATQVPVITFDADGRATGVTNTTITTADGNGIYSGSGSTPGGGSQVTLTDANPLILYSTATSGNPLRYTIAQGGGIQYNNTSAVVLNRVYSTGSAFINESTTRQQTIQGATSVNLLATDGIKAGLFTVNENNYVTLPSYATFPTVTGGNKTGWNSTLNRITYADGGVEKLVANVADDIQGTYTLYAASNNLGYDEHYAEFDANAGAITVTVGPDMKEHIPYTVRCRRNGTNLITFEADVGYYVGVDGDSTIPGDASIAVGGGGSGIQAPYKIYTLIRVGSVIWLND
jgi:hypothetical protein